MYSPLNMYHHVSFSIFQLSDDFSHCFFLYFFSFVVGGSDSIMASVFSMATIPSGGLGPTSFVDIRTFHIYIHT